MKEEKIISKGAFRVDVFDSESGSKIETFYENNLVVSLGHNNLAKLLGGEGTGKKISKIALGTNGTTPVLSDSVITQMFNKTIDAVTYPKSNSVKFNWSINADEANGLVIREFGLLNDDGVLCARKVRTDIVKTSAVRLVGSWEITFN